MAEKRVARRVPLDIYINKYLDGRPYLVRTKNISKEGIYLSKLLEPRFGGGRVGLQFQLPGTSQIIYAEGELMRDVRAGASEGNGVRFTFVPPEFQRLIDRYVERLRQAA